MLAKAITNILTVTSPSCTSRSAHPSQVPGTHAIDRTHFRGHWPTSDVTIADNTIAPPEPSSKRGGTSGVWIFVWVVVSVALVGGLAYWQRYLIYDKCPAVEASVGTLSDAVSRAFGQGGAGAY